MLTAHRVCQILLHKIILPHHQHTTNNVPNPKSIQKLLKCVQLGLVLSKVSTLKNPKTFAYV